MLQAKILAPLNWKKYPQTFANLHLNVICSFISDNFYSRLHMNSLSDLKQFLLPKA